MLVMVPDDLLDQICEDERAALLQQLRLHARPDNAYLLPIERLPKLLDNDDL